MAPTAKSASSSDSESGLASRSTSPESRTGARSSKKHGGESNGGNTSVGSADSSNLESGEEGGESSASGSGSEDDGSSSSVNSDADAPAPKGKSKK